MRQIGIEPEVITYSGAISACEEMRQIGREPEVIVYSGAFCACEKA